MRGCMAPALESGLHYSEFFYSFFFNIYYYIYINIYQMGQYSYQMVLCVLTICSLFQRPIWRFCFFYELSMDILFFFLPRMDILLSYIQLNFFSFFSFSINAHW